MTFGTWSRKSVFADGCCSPFYPGMRGLLVGQDRWLKGMSGGSLWQRKNLWKPTGAKQQAGAKVCAYRAKVGLHRAPQWTQEAVSVVSWCLLQVTQQGGKLWATADLLHLYISQDFASCLVSGLITWDQAKTLLTYLHKKKSSQGTLHETLAHITWCCGISH